MLDQLAFNSRSEMIEALVMKNIGNKGNRLFMVVSMVIASCSLAEMVMAQESKNQDDTQAKELIRQWVAAERLLGEERISWKEEQAQVNELLKLHVAELKLLNEELAQAGRSVSEVDKQKAELEAKVADGIQSRTTLRQFLLKLKPRVIALEKRFPEILKTQVAESISILMTVNDETSVREILQATVDVLEKASTFNVSIYQGSESVSIGAETWNAEVIYLGLGRAYFYIAGKAGVGVAGTDGWVWTRNDDILGEVKKAVEVFKKQKRTQLIELPIQVKPSF